MKKIYLAIFTLAFLAGCQKDEIIKPVIDPEMQYTDLHDSVVSSNQFVNVDIDADGKRDFSFETLLVGDPILQRDRLQFYANSKIGTNLMNDENDQSPVMQKGELISLNPSGYTWWEISAIVLAEKIDPLVGSPYWDGPWKNASHKYLPVQVKKNELIYQGWIELSMNTEAGQLILHKAAISREAGKNIKAGY